jgi:hypothetical protein
MTLLGLVSHRAGLSRDLLYTGFLVWHYVQYAFLLMGTNFLRLQTLTLLASFFAKKLIPDHFLEEKIQTNPKPPQQF